MLVKEQEEVEEEISTKDLAKTKVLVCSDNLFFVYYLYFSG